MRVLVAGWIGSTNLGDELVFAGMRRLLAAHDIRPVAISEDPSRTRAVHGVNAIHGRDLAAVARVAAQADAMIFGGGGLLQDDSSVLNLPYHLARVAAARRAGTPVAGIGLGVGGLSTGLGRRLTRQAMVTVEPISVRDQPSLDLLTSLGVTGGVLAADTAFALDPPEVTAADRIVACLRPWTVQRSRQRWRPASRQGDPTPQPEVEALASALDVAATRTGLPVHLVAWQPDRDDPLHHRVAAHMRAPVTCDTPGLAGIVAEVARSRVVVSMRYHGGVAAVLAGRPVVLVDYASKVGALADELGPAARLHHFDAGDLARIADSVEQVADRSDAVLAARARLQQRQQANANAVATLLARAAG